MAETKRKCETFEEGQTFVDDNGNECKATFDQMIELARKWIKEHTNIKNVNSAFGIKYNKESINKQVPIRTLNIYYE